MTTTTVGTSAALNSALQRAAAGDTILLAPGTYSGVSANGLHFAQDVTITSQSASNPAAVTGLAVASSSGLTFQGLDFKVGASDNPFQVRASQDVHFANLDVHGSLDGNAGNDKAAFLIRNSSDVSVQNSEFQQVAVAVGHLDDSHLTISGNKFHDISVDGVHGGGSSNVTITNNDFYDFKPQGGAHPDAIQFWTAGATTAAHDIVVSNNSIVRGDGSTAQGIFITDQVGSLPYKNVTISGNLVSGDAYNGIMVLHGTNVSVTNNIVWGFSDQQSWIRLDKIAGGTVTGNTANSFITAGLNSVAMSNNKTVAPATDHGAAAEALWPGHTGGGETGASAPAEPAAPSTPTQGVSLTGGTGAEALTGTGFADTISGGGGADQMTGGAGNDLYVTTSASKVVELAGGGTDTVHSSTSFTLSANVENLELTGTTAYNGQGNGSNNSIVGNSIGNGLSGREGADTLNGAGGADTIMGGTGDDVLIGGSSADKFVFAKGDGHDVVQDFGLGGEHDVLDISGLLYAGLHPTLTDASAGVTLSFSSGDSILLEGVHANQLHATTSGYIF